MTQAEICPKFQKCPTFSDSSFEDNTLSANLKEMYKRNYCKGAKAKYSACKRFIAANELGIPIP